MAAVEHQRCEFLRGGAGGGAASVRKAADFQYRSGLHFHRRGFHQQACDGRRRDSMDGRGRFMDNIFIKPLWRSIKYEEVHLKAYADGCEARSGISSWMTFYNFRRPHQAMNNRCRWRCGAPAWTKSRRRRGLWICRFAWTTKRVAHILQQRQKQPEAARFLKDNGRPDHTLNSTPRGPTNGVQFNSKSGSSDIASKIRHQTPLMLHRLKRRNTLFQSPNASGRSRHGEPVRTIHSTPSTIIRLSRPVEPFWSGRHRAGCGAGCARRISATRRPQGQKTPSRTRRRLKC